LTDILENGPKTIIDGVIMNELASRVLILAEVFRHRLFDKLILANPTPQETQLKR